MFGDRVGPVVLQNSCYVGALGRGASRVESTSRLGVGFPTLIQCPAPPSTYSSRFLTASPGGREGRSNRNYLLCALRGKKKSRLLPPGLFLSPHPLSSSEFVSFHCLALQQLRCFQKSPPCSPMALSSDPFPGPYSPLLLRAKPCSSVLFICSHCCFLTALPSIVFCPGSLLSHLLWALIPISSSGLWCPPSLSCQSPPPHPCSHPTGCRRCSGASPSGPVMTVAQVICECQT